MHTIYFYNICCQGWEITLLTLEERVCGLILPNFATKRAPLFEVSPCFKHLKRHLKKVKFEKGRNFLFQEVQKTLTAYFNKHLSAFSLPLTFIGTPFQKTVWKALLHIPYGETITYRALAERLKRPRAFRAVAQACRANPLPILIPCHRVIGQKGLTGYAAGLAWKEFLLNLEKGK
ncbi:MAG: methylated-DNA--[protein]-cysteine S-methyltransferase [Candidatus Desulfofervidaceae bacterium]|nr:methylated-DNA--[protein]-cysteine S-methyltransferase [Candidatus Desulfofervidaceae bacterium]MDL1970710.1 methylated-DNA--[protein]-cysteine S-methyltransferase [Candidatus Desulfofervidaceae bacterium]